MRSRAPSNLAEHLGHGSRVRIDLPVPDAIEILLKFNRTPAPESHGVSVGTYVIARRRVGPARERGAPIIQFALGNIEVFRPESNSEAVWHSLVHAIPRIADAGDDLAVVSPAPAVAICGADDGELVVENPSFGMNVGVYVGGAVVVEDIDFNTILCDGLERAEKPGLMLFVKRALPANLWVIFSDGKAKRGKIG